LLLRTGKGKTGANQALLRVHATSQSFLQGGLKAEVQHLYSNPPLANQREVALTIGGWRKGIETRADASGRLSLLDWLESDLASYG
jgi:hypothetical protein